MEALKVDNVCKTYRGFSLDHISFSIPEGAIMGFIGENGAGKSTTIKNLLGMNLKDSGTVTVFGELFTGKENRIKEKLGVVLDETFFAPGVNAIQIEKALRIIYRNWNSRIFYDYLKKFKLDLKKNIKDYSKGMKMKLSIAAALSHDAKLLILDEVTSGLDPVIRNEVLDLLLEFIQDEKKSILISSHILSDLEKICDYITFIDNGKIIFSENKDELLESYCLVKGSIPQIRELNSDMVRGVSENAFGARALVHGAGVPEGLIMEPVTIEELMLLWKKERM